MSLNNFDYSENLSLWIWALCIYRVFYSSTNDDALVLICRSVKLMNIFFVGCGGIKFICQVHSDLSSALK